MDKQEPVAYVTDSGKSAYILLGVDLDDDTPLYVAPPKEEEGCAQCGKRASDGWALYCVGCSERAWVGLTDDELPEGVTYEFDRGVRWAEAKLKEKNGG